MAVRNQPGKFWTSRVMQVASFHLAIFAIVSTLAQMDISYSAFSDTAFSALGDATRFLGLPLSEIAPSPAMTAVLFGLPEELRPLIVIALLGVNSLIWGFAVDGYLKMAKNLRERRRR